MRESNFNSIFVVSTVRNVSKTLMSDCNSLLGAFEGFGRLIWIITESDSSDNTIEVLESAKKKFENFHYFALGNLQDLGWCRTERIAIARNRSLNFLYSHFEPLDTDYIVLADLDGRNSKISRKSVASCWQLEQSWDVCCANQKGPYYDIWALRHPSWCPADCWQEYFQFLSDGFDQKQAFDLAVKSKMIIIPHSQKPIRVDSAYGGLAIYRANLLRNAEYVGRDESGKEQCDHVSVNLTLTRGGAKILINPSLINGNTRSFRNSDLFRTLKYKLGNIFFKHKQNRS
jgi:hypothetical protein